MLTWRACSFCLFNFVTDQSTAVIEEGVTYLQHLVGAAWHRQLALHCSARLLSHRHFYTLRNRDARVHDADQRISEEVKVNQCLLFSPIADGHCLFVRTGPRSTFRFVDASVFLPIE